MHARLRVFFLGLGTALIAVFVYLPALSHDFVSWDDPRLVFDNPAVRELSFGGVRTIFTTYDPKLYIPLTLLSFTLQSAVLGMDPMWFHLGNILLHGANVFFFALLLRRLFRDDRAMVVGALLFALHPVQVEAVAWVSGRKDLLAAFFLLLSLHWYLQRKFFLGLAGFTLSLLAKPVVLLLPLILLLIDRWNGRSWNRQTLLEKLPYAAIGLAFTVVAVAGFRGGEDTAAAVSPFIAFIESLGFSLRLLIWPFAYSAMYPSNILPSVTSTWFIASCIAFAILLLFGVRTWRFAPALLAGLGFFGLALLPALLKGASPDNTVFAADRYLYVPMFGVAFIVAWAFISLRRFRSAALSFFGAGIFFLSIITFTHIPVWANSRVLYEQTISAQPKAYIAWNNLGTEMLNHGDASGALNAFTEALEIAPHFIHARLNRGVALYRLGRTGEAVGQFAEVLAADPRNVEALYNLAVLAEGARRPTEALMLFVRVLEFRPDHRGALAGRARLTGPKE